MAQQGTSVCLTPRLCQCLPRSQDLGPHYSKHVETAKPKHKGQTRRCQPSRRPYTPAGLRLLGGRRPTHLSSWTLSLPRAPPPKAGFTLRESPLSGNLPSPWVHSTGGEVSPEWGPLLQTCPLSFPLSSCFTWVLPFPRVQTTLPMAAQACPDVPCAK